MSIQYGFTDFATLVLLGFVCVLRTSEILELKCGHVKFQRAEAVIRLCGKSRNRYGTSEEVILDDETLLWMLRRLCAHKRSMQALYARGPGHFRQTWRWIVPQLGLNSMVLKPYCLRRGGATFEWATNQDAAVLCVKGGWKSHSTARPYAVEGAELLAATELTQETCHKVAWWMLRLQQQWELMQTSP